MSQREHILHRSNMYIGDTAQHNEEQFVFDKESQKIMPKMVKYSPGFLKIFDEVLTNAIDHANRDPTVTKIKVSIGEEISVYNNGKGVPVQIHKDYNVYVPELIFGHLLSSSNYDDTQQRTGAGVNGIGVKLSNIYSKHFKIETVDSESGQKFVQEYFDNMSVIKPAKITKSKVASYTQITFTPDYVRFGMQGSDYDYARLQELLYKRVYDCIACTPNISIYLDGKCIKGKGLLDYAKYFFTGEKLIYEKFASGKFIWEYAITASSDTFTQVSFVNGNCTYNGGKHVDAIMYQIVTKIKSLLESKRKIKDVRPSIIKDKFFLFLSATVVNPQFSSQTKDTLVTQSKDFGCRPEVSDAFIGKIFKSDMIEDIVAICKAKETADMKKATDGKKKATVFIPKLEDALFAGTAKSNQCTLLLTEGDSGKTFAMWGRPNADYFGVFPLKGKLLNVRDASASQLVNNEEINCIKQILGLKQGMEYNDLNANTLRYTRICILADADQDAQHIKGLLINVFHTWWPSLLKCKKSFITTLRTPIVKVTKGKVSKEFFTEQDYEAFVKSGHGHWNARYYKGLGTSTKQDSKSIFSRFDELKLEYYHDGTECDDSILLAFEKDKNVKGKPLVKYSDKRKEWLGKYNRDLYIHANARRVPFSEMIHKELVHFSIYDNVRSIPNIMDGFKPSQRKIIWYCLEKGIHKEIKVAQLSGYVSAETAYHHGEASLQQAIIGMCQNFIGSNNMTLLRPESCFGSRLTGKDAASPRYIFTHLEKWASVIFNKHDSEALNYNYDDGARIEPEYLVPIVPMVLVNGCEGIGTGYSTSIPSFNIKDIITSIRNMLVGKPSMTLVPWFNNFKGTIQEDGTSFVTRGLYTRTNACILITEIPVGTWLTPYKEFLESLCEGNTNGATKHPFYGKIKSVHNATLDENTDIRITVTFVNEKTLDACLDDDFAKNLKLVKTSSTNNMYLFNKDLVVTKYDTPNAILEDYYHVRLGYYTQRRINLIKKLENSLLIESEKMRFIKGYLDGTIKIVDVHEDVIEARLEELKFVKAPTYEYLLGMPIRALTSTRLSVLRDTCEKRQLELDVLSKKNDKQLWLDDLEALEKLI